MPVIATPGTARLGSAMILRGRSLDHLVGAAEDRLRDREPERLGGLQVDDQLELGGWLDWQIAGRRAL
jgi:hypothetical protein